MHRRAFVKASALTAVSAAAGVGGYTWQVEPHWVKVVERDLPIAHLPPALTGARLVQVSDVHVGPRVDNAYLIDALRRAASLRPDIVVVTGDFISYRQDRGDAQFEE